MRESIGSTFLYNMIFLFIIIVFGLLTGTLNYYKAYKVNERILGTIAKDSGYNSVSKKEIDNYLSSIGYTLGGNGTQLNCPQREGATMITSNKAGAGDNNYLYCVYYFPDETGGKDKGKKNADGRPIYYAYGVTTYIYVELPIVGNFKIPVYSKGERIYRFKGSCQVGGDATCRRV